MHKPSPPLRRNSSLGGVLPTSAVLQQAQQKQQQPRSGSNTPTPQASPSTTPRVINLNAMLPQQTEVIYMQPHVHLQQQQQQQTPPPPSNYAGVPLQHYATTGAPHNGGAAPQVPLSVSTSQPDEAQPFWPPPPPPVQESDYAELDTIQMQISESSLSNPVNYQMSQQGPQHMAPHQMSLPHQGPGVVQYNVGPQDPQTLPGNQYPQQRPTSIGHISSSHSSIMQSLNAKLCTSTGRHPSVNGSEVVYSTTNQAMAASTLSYSSDDITPTAETPMDNIYSHLKHSMH